VDFSYPKNEKLKSRKTIDLLFTEGKTVTKYPLRLVYMETTFDDNVPLKIGVSVSKKHFKNAVDRNYFKRVLRECYRLNKHILTDNIDKKFAMLFFYQTKDRLSYQEINEKTILLFEKFVKAIQAEKLSS
jgi:ribonuclease P protein component